MEWFSFSQIKRNKRPLAKLIKSKPARVILLLGCCFIQLSAIGEGIIDSAWAKTGAVDFVWSGGVTDTEAVIVTKTKSAGSRVVCMVSANKDLSHPAYISPVKSPDADNVVRFDSVSGLKANTRYYYGIKVNGYLETALNDADNGAGMYTGKFKTFPMPGQSASFKFAFACSNSEPDSIAFEKLRAYAPDFFIQTGDFHYADINGTDVETNRSDHRAQYEKKLNVTGMAPRQASFYRSTAIAYMWDDHDFGPNDAHAKGSSLKKRTTLEAQEAVHAVYRQYTPHYPLGLAGDAAFITGQEPICQAFAVGRVRFILTDIRSQSEQNEPDDYDATMLGSRQKEWFKEELLKASGTYPLIVWLTTTPWNGKQKPVKGNKWYQHTSERREIANFLKKNHIQGFCAIAGDMHATTIDDGANTDFADGGGAGFPIFHAASLGTKTSYKGGPYNRGAAKRDHQYGRFEVVDNGKDIAVTWKGWDCDTDAVSVPTQDDEGDGRVQYTFTRSSPVVTGLFPADDAVYVSPDSKLVMVFNKNVRKGKGAIRIHDHRSGKVVETIDVASGSVYVQSKQVLIEPKGTFPDGRTYYVTMDQGTITNGKNSFAGIYAPLGMDYKRWNFTVQSSCAN